MEYHRCFRMYITKTRVTRISDTVFFKHQYIMNQILSLESHMVAAAQHLKSCSKKTYLQEKKQLKHYKKSASYSPKYQWQKMRQQRPRPIATGFAQPKRHDK